MVVQRERASEGEPACERENVTHICAHAYILMHICSSNTFTHTCMHLRVLMHTDSKVCRVLGLRVEGDQGFSGSRFCAWRISDSAGLGFRGLDSSFLVWRIGNPLPQRQFVGTRVHVRGKRGWRVGRRGGWRERGQMAAGADS